MINWIWGSLAVITSLVGEYWYRTHKDNWYPDCLWVAALAILGSYFVWQMHRNDTIIGITATFGLLRAIGGATTTWWIQDHVPAKDWAAYLIILSANIVRWIF